MIASDVINKFMRTVVNTIVGDTEYSIKAKQDAPRPEGPYASVVMLTDGSVGMEQTTFENEAEPELDIIETVEGLRNTIMSINFYRANAIDNCRKVHLGVTTSNIQQLFRDAKLGFILRSEVRELSDDLENGWEERAQFDITLNNVGTIQDIINTIQSVEIDGTFETESKSYNFKIEVN